MISLPVLNNSLFFQTFESSSINPPSSTTITQFPLPMTSHLIPTYPSQFILNAVTPSFIYDTSLLARPVFRQDLPIIGYSVRNSSNSIESSKNLVNEQTESTKTERNSCHCCCCTNQCSSNNNNNNNNNESVKKVETNENIETIQKLDLKKESEQPEIVTKDKIDYEIEEKLSGLSLEEKIKLIRKELNLSNKDDDQILLDKNPICYCKTSNEASKNLFEKEQIINSNEKTKYLVNYMPVHKEKCNSCSYNEKNRVSSSASSLGRKSRSKSPKAWIPVGRNDYSSNRLHFNDYSNDITKIQHLGGINNTNITNTSTTKATNTASSQTEIVKPVKYYTVTTRIPAKTTIRTTINSNSYYPTVKYKETMSTVDYTPNSVKYQKWSGQNF
jgi:hypothetical protein